MPLICVVERGGHLSIEKPARSGQVHAGREDLAVGRSEPEDLRIAELEKRLGEPIMKSSSHWAQTWKATRRVYPRNGSHAGLYFPHRLRPPGRERLEYADELT
jgi:hypothetical protein